MSAFSQSRSAGEFIFNPVPSIIALEEVGRVPPFLLETESLSPSGRGLTVAEDGLSRALLGRGTSSKVLLLLKTDY